MTYVVIPEWAAIIIWYGPFKEKAGIDGEILYQGTCLADATEVAHRNPGWKVYAFDGKELLRTDEIEAYEREWRRG